MSDSNVEAVRAKLAARAELGLIKYGVTTERTDLPRLQWLQHLQDELMDAAVYAERLMQEEDEIERLRAWDAWRNQPDDLCAMLLFAEVDAAREAVGPCS